MKNYNLKIPLYNNRVKIKKNRMKIQKKINNSIIRENINQY